MGQYYFHTSGDRDHQRMVNGRVLGRKTRDTPQRRPRRAVPVEATDSGGDPNPSTPTDYAPVPFLPAVVRNCTGEDLKAGEVMYIDPRWPIEEVGDSPSSVDYGWFNYPQVGRPTSVCSTDDPVFDAPPNTSGDPDGDSPLGTPGGGAPGPGGGDTGAGFGEGGGGPYDPAEGGTYDCYAGGVDDGAGAPDTFARWSVREFSGQEYEWDAPDTDWVLDMGTSFTASEVTDKGFLLVYEGYTLCTDPDNVGATTISPEPPGPDSQVDIYSMEVVGSTTNLYMVNLSGASNTSPASWWVKVFPPTTSGTIGVSDAGSAQQVSPSCVTGSTNYIETFAFLSTGIEDTSEPGEYPEPGPAQTDFTYAGTNSHGTRTVTEKDKTGASEQTKKVQFYSTVGDDPQDTCRDYPTWNDYANPPGTDARAHRFTGSLSLDPGTTPYPGTDCDTRVPPSSAFGFVSSDDLTFGSSEGTAVDPWKGVTPGDSISQDPPFDPATPNTLWSGPPYMFVGTHPDHSAGYDNDGTFYTRDFARLQIEKNREGRLAILLGDATAGQPAWCAVGGLGRAWVYIRDPSHRYVGPPPYSSMEERDLSPAEGSLDKFLTAYWRSYNNEGVGDTFVGRPKVLYSYPDPQPCGGKILKAFRADVDEWLIDHTPPIVDIEIQITKTAGTAAVSAATVTVHNATGVTQTASTTSTTATGNLYENFGRYNRPIFRPHATRIGTHGCIRVTCGDWRYELDSDAMSACGDGTVVKELFRYTSFRVRPDSHAKVHPWVYLNVDDPLVDDLPRLPVASDDGLPQPGVTSGDAGYVDRPFDFDPYFGRILGSDADEEIDDLRLGLQVALIELDGGALGTGGCC